MFDLTDYSQFLEAERDELMDEALEQDRVRDVIEANSDDIILEMEVMLMMEMV